MPYSPLGPQTLFSFAPNHTWLGKEQTWSVLLCEEAELGHKAGSGQGDKSPPLVALGTWKFQPNIQTQEW